MYLFENAFEPSDSWANDNHNYCQSYITAGISISATYMVMVRAKYDAYPGTCDIRINDYPAYSNAKVGGAGMSTSTMDGDYDHQTGDLNFFCCPNNGDANSNFMYLSTGPYDPIKYFKSGYSGPGVFPSINTRIKLDNYSGSTLDYVILSVNTGDMTDVGNCDVYVGLKSATRDSIFTYYFLDLDSDDAIQSDSATYWYNCHAWAGGITRGVVNPFEPGCPWRDDSSIMYSYDHYYKNVDQYNVDLPRYIGALNYVRTTNVNEADIAVWIREGNYTHSSIKRDSDHPHPHGYAWESKIGNWERVMHPFGVGGGGRYGSESVFYKWDGTYKTTGTPGSVPYFKIANEDKDIILKEFKSKGYFTLEESITAGLSVYIDKKLGMNEQEQLTLMLNEIPVQAKRELDKLYNDWKETLPTSDTSIYNTEDYVDSIEYNSFINYCKKYGKEALAYLFLKYNKGDSFAVYAIDELSFKNNNSLLQEVQNDLLNDRYTEDGVYIVPTTKEKVTRYITKLLQKPDDQWFIGKNDTLPQNNSQTPAKLSIKPNNPNPFNPSTIITYGLPSESHVTIIIYDILGRKVKTLINNSIYSAGWHTVLWNGHSESGVIVSSGIYLCKIITDNGVISQKLLFAR